MRFAILSVFSLSNCLSFSRLPLAFLFLFENTTIRISAIILAMITDSIDGYFARRSKTTSRFGAVLDPAMDKFFVYFVLGVFLLDKQIEPWQACAMISRDFALCAFGIYLFISQKWRQYEIKPVSWGKITTAMQFLVLIGLTAGYVFPWYIYGLFIIAGALTLCELFFTIGNRLSTF